MIMDMIKKCHLEIMRNDSVLKPSDYIEKWRLTIWYQAYITILSEKVVPKSFSKGTTLVKFPNGELAVKRLVYRYFICELVAKKVLSSSALPESFVGACDLDDDNHVFTEKQHERFTLDQLKTGAWFLDCSGSYVPPGTEDLAVSVCPLSSRQRQSHVTDDDNSDFVEEVPRLAARGAKKKAAPRKPYARIQPSTRNVASVEGGPSSQTESGPLLS